MNNWHWKRLSIPRVSISLKLKSVHQQDKASCDPSLFLAPLLGWGRGLHLSRRLMGSSAPREAGAGIKDVSADLAVLPRSSQPGQTGRVWVYFGHTAAHMGFMKMSGAWLPGDLRTKLLFYWQERSWALDRLLTFPHSHWARYLPSSDPLRLPRSRAFCFLFPRLARVQGCALLCLAPNGLSVLYQSTAGLPLLGGI